MRLWTVHPRYLDVKGLTAVWREGLLARAVLLGRTKGYTNHPQLVRFRATADPVAAVNAYLGEVLAESCCRGYRYDASKIDPATVPPMEETTGQLDYEWAHLLRKLKTRAPERYRQFREIERPEPHPLFTLVPGHVQDWEKR